MKKHLLMMSMILLMNPVSVYAEGSLPDESTEGVETEVNTETSLPPEGYVDEDALAELKSAQTTTAEDDIESDEAEDSLPAIHGEFGVAIDAHTGEILYEKNAEEKAFPASITKIMTAMLLDEHVEDGEEMTASEWASGQEASNSHFKLTAGEKIKKEDAMMALMVMSANDVAMTVAEHVAGSQEEFASMMNDKAKEIGATNTNFTSPSGLHDDAHYTTAYDMALITKEAMKHPFVMEAMGTKSSQIETDKQKLEIVNSSQIHDNPLALGGKTGYTGMAQNTLVEILEKDDKKVIAVVMKTTLAEEYNDIGFMGDYAFEQMKPSKKVVERGRVMGTATIGDREVKFLSADDFYIEHEEGDEVEVTQDIVPMDFDGSPIYEGQEVGKAIIMADGEEVGEVLLVADQDVLEAEGETTVKETKKEKKEKKEKDSEDEDSISLLSVLLCILIPLFLYIGFLIFYNYKKRQELRRK